MRTRLPRRLSILTIQCDAKRMLTQQKRVVFVTSVFLDFEEPKCIVFQFTRQARWFRANSSRNKGESVLLAHDREFLIDCGCGSIACGRGTNASVPEPLQC